jgi:hypothetical protein
MPQTQPGPTQTRRPTQPWEVAGEIPCGRLRRVRVVGSTHRAHGLAKSDPVTDHQADCSTRRSSCRFDHQHLARWATPTCPGYQPCQPGQGDNLRLWVKLGATRSPSRWPRPPRSPRPSAKAPQTPATPPGVRQDRYRDLQLAPDRGGAVWVSRPASIAGGGRSICRPIWKSPPKPFDGGSDRRRHRRQRAEDPARSERSI